MFVSWQNGLVGLVLGFLVGLIVDAFSLWFWFDTVWGGGLVSVLCDFCFGFDFVDYLMYSVVCVWIGGLDGFCGFHSLFVYCYLVLVVVLRVLVVVGV